MDYNLENFPPSYSYAEIINNIKINEIAYCYMSDTRNGSFLIRLSDNTLKSFIPKGEESGGKRNVFEVWTYIHEIPNGNIRQEAINRWYAFYLSNYDYLGFDSYDFRLE